MNHVVQAFLRSSAVKVVRRAFSAPLLPAFGAIAAFPDRASTRTAFSLPAPPFELPLLPSVSGSWTVMIGAGDGYKPDLEGSERGMLSPVPILSIRRAGFAEQFHSPGDGASIAIIEFGDLRAGPVGKFVGDSKSKQLLPTQAGSLAIRGSANQTIVGIGASYAFDFETR